MGGEGGWLMAVLSVRALRDGLEMELRSVLRLVAASDGAIALSSCAVHIEYTFVLRGGIIGANN